MHPRLQKHLLNVFLCCRKEQLQMQNLTKYRLYNSLRLQGKRLYSTKTWVNASALTSPPNHSILNMYDQKRFLRSPAVTETDTTFTSRLKEKMGFQGALRYPQKVLSLSGFHLYLSAAEAVIYNELYQNLTLPNTLQAWHKLTTLHIWMIMTRLGDFGRDGKLVRNQLIKSLQADVTAKSKQIGKALEIRVKSEEQESLHEQFLAALLNFDEGLLGSDRHLAAAIWRSVFNLTEDVNPVDLELLVQYTRKQVAHMETIPMEVVLSDGYVPFVSLHGNKVSKRASEKLDDLRKTNVQLAA